MLYGHVFRNAMLIVIAGFPGAFIGAFFTGSLLIEQVFSLDGLGYLSYDSLIQRDYPVVLANLYIFALIGLVVNLVSDPHLHLDRSSHRFRNARGVSLVDTDRLAPTSDTAPLPEEAVSRVLPLNEKTDSWERAEARASLERRPWLSPMNRRRLDNFRRHRRGAWSFWIFLVLFVASLFAEFIANDRPLIASYKGEVLFPVLFDYPEDKFGGFQARADFRDPFIADEIKAHGWI